jgi:hypothetical protein
MTGRQSGQQFASAIPNAKPVRAIVNWVRRVDAPGERLRAIAMPTVWRQPELSSAQGAGGD